MVVTFVGVPIFASASAAFTGVVGFIGVATCSSMLRYALAKKDVSVTKDNLVATHARITSLAADEPTIGVTSMADPTSFQ